MMPAYIEALAASVQEHRREFGITRHLLMSFHGVPERYVALGDPYREQCQRTATLARAAARTRRRCVERFLPVALRSRTLAPALYQRGARGLPKRGVKSVSVICPGFAADCLETLEEIGMENRDVFLAAGGEQYHYIPALNARADHVASLSALVIARAASNARRGKRKGCPCMLWLKAFHIIGVVSWFAALLYLPRLVRISLTDTGRPIQDTTIDDDAGNARFKIMERKLFMIMTIGAVIAIGFGVAMLASAPDYLLMRWLHVKLALVLVLVGYHGALLRAAPAVRRGSKLAFGTVVSAVQRGAGLTADRHRHPGGRQTVLSGAVGACKGRGLLPIFSANGKRSYLI